MIDATAYAEPQVRPPTGAVAEDRATVAPPAVASPPAGTLPAWVLLPVGLLLCAAWAAMIWMSTHLQPDPTLRSVALFAHLAAMVAGFGAVLVIDWVGLLWSIGRRTFADVTHTAHAVHSLIWLSLAGLTFSGMLLYPDPSSPLTRIKLALVLVVALNGLHAHLLHRRLVALGDRPPPNPLLLLAGLTALVSQACWWAAMAIGFVNHQS
jgi:hypothetical protein